MKKLFEKLFKNVIFKKIILSVTFVTMCSFACFMNWKSTVGAEEENNQPYTTSTVSFNVKEIDSSGEESVFTKLNIQYAISDHRPGADQYIDFNPNGIELEIGKKIYIKISPKPGYDTSNLEYSVNDDLQYKLWSKSDNLADQFFSSNPFINGEGFLVTSSTILNLKSVDYKLIYLHFIDGDRFGDEGHNIPLDPHLVKIYNAGFSSPMDYNGSTVKINGVLKMDFCIELGDYCQNEKLQLEENFESSPVFINSENMTNTELNFYGSYWDSLSNQFILRTNIHSSNDIYIKIKGLEYKKASFKFVQDRVESFDQPIQLFKEDDTVYDNWQNNNSSGDNDSYLEIENACNLTDNFTFYLKTSKFVRWSSEELQWHDLITLTDYYDGSISASYDETKNAYQMTFNNINNAQINIKLHSNIIVISRMSVKFTSINLPNDAINHNGITVKQGNIEANYPDRGNQPYTLLATISPPYSSDTITISLSDTENYDFEHVIDEYDHPNDFTFYDGDKILVATSFEIISNVNYEKEVTFKIDRIINKLETGKDVTVYCNCLKPKQKKVQFALGNGVTAVLKDGENSTPITEDQDVPISYGFFASIIFTIKEGYSMNDPEECVKVQKLADVPEDITNLELTQISDNTYEINLFDLITDDINIVFKCDQDDTSITFKNFEGADYYAVHRDASNGDDTGNSNSFSITNSNNEKELLKGIVTIKSGDDYYFAVGAQAGYDIEKLNITSNGIKIDVSDVIQHGGDKYAIYKLTTVEMNVTVNGSISKKEMTVKFLKHTKVEEPNSNEDETATINYKRDNYDIGSSTEDAPSVNITYGNAITFTANLDDKYSQSNFKVFVCDLTSNVELEQNTLEELQTNTNLKLQEITKYQNEYRLTDITTNKIIFVKGVKLNKYVLNFVPSSQAEFLINDTARTGTINVYYGESFEFKVRAKTGYTLDDQLAVNCLKDSGDTSLKDKVLDSTENESNIYKFTLNNITENHTLVVDKVENITYTITLANVDGATYLNDRNAVISGDIKINYGKNFEFGVTVDDAYDDSIAGMYIIINDGKSRLTSQKLSSGRYMIPNITEDITVKVGNIRKNTYTVTLRNEDGIDYYNSADKLITGDNTVNHAESLSFRVYVYPSYSDSSITVMLGNDKITPDSSGYYTVSGVVENKTVTVIGLHPNSEVELVNTINNLPSSINDLNDVGGVIEASKWYNSLNDAQKANITNFDVLSKLQEQAGAILHKSNDVTIDGVNWHIKLVVVPISSDMDACSRIYKKLNSEYILSLYDIYLWDTLKDTRYTPSSDEMYTITVPAPRLVNFSNPTGVHENSESGKISFMDLTFSGDTVSFETNSFSAMGIVASLDTSGASSLFDAAGVNLDWINDYVVGYAKSNSSNKNISSGTVIRNADAAEDYANGDEIIGNINDKFKSANNRVTPQGSALRLILALLILILLALAIWVIYKRQKEEKDKK